MEQKPNQPTKKRKLFDNFRQINIKDFDVEFKKKILKNEQAKLDSKVPQAQGRKRSHTANQDKLVEILGKNNSNETQKESRILQFLRKKERLKETEILIDKVNTPVVKSESAEVEDTTRNNLQNVESEEVEVRPKVENRVKEVHNPEPKPANPEPLQPENKPEGATKDASNIKTPTQPENKEDVVKPEQEEPKKQTSINLDALEEMSGMMLDDLGKYLPYLSILHYIT